MPTEKSLLTLSLYAVLIFAALAVGWGVLGNSQVILFDGLYSLVSAGLSYVSLWSVKYIKKTDSQRFPFGKEMIEPLVILAKFAVITMLCLFALFSGITSIISGGQAVDPASGMLYALIASSSCMGVYLYLAKKQRLLHSGFVAAEAEQWLMDFYLSFAVLLGFIAAWFIASTRFQHVLPYVDPVMVVLVSAYALKVPLSQMGKQVREVLDMSAEDHYTLRIETVVKAIETKYHFTESFARVAKSGPKLFVEIDFVVGADGWEPSLEEQDRIREEIVAGIGELSLKKWLNVSFTKDRKWAVDDLV
jgi:cation diffusion facilitator family transporter